MRATAGHKYPKQDFNAKPTIFFRSNSIYPKLTLNASNDYYKQEVIQTTPWTNHSVQRMCASCEKEEEKMLQRREVSPQAFSAPFQHILSSQTLLTSSVGQLSVIQRNETDDAEAVAEEEGERFRAGRRVDLGRIIEGLRFRKVLRDCPRQGSDRLHTLLTRVRQRALSNPQCNRFFQRTFGFGPERVLDLNRPPTVMIDPDLTFSGQTRCPSPSVRLQPAICNSPLQDRVIMHELTHYAGCLAHNRPTSEEVAERGEDICIDTVARELERRRQRAREQPTGTSPDSNQ